MPSASVFTSSTSATACFHTFLSLTLAALTLSETQISDKVNSELIFVDFYLLFFECQRYLPLEFLVETLDGPV